MVSNMVDRKFLLHRVSSSWCFYMNCRRLNAIAQMNAYPLLRVDVSLNSLTFSILNSESAYWQVAPEQDAKEKSAFMT